MIVEAPCSDLEDLTQSESGCFSCTVFKSRNFALSDLSCVCACVCVFARVPQD